jgi:hypothetical protein
MEAIASAKPLDYLPIGLFGSTMGLAGLSVDWKLANTVSVYRFGFPWRLRRSQ